MEKNNFKKLINFFFEIYYKKKNYIFLLVIFFLTLIIFKINILKIFIILLYLFLGSVSKLYQKFIKISLGFEFITPVVLFFAYKLGFWFSLIGALLMLIFSSLLANKLEINGILSQLFVYSIIAFIISFFNKLNFLEIAIIMIILRAIIFPIIQVGFMGGDLNKTIVYIIGNTICNILVISFFGNSLISYI